LLAQGPPRGMSAAVEKTLLDADQQMIGEHAQEDVGLGAMLELVKNRPFRQRRLERAEGSLHPGEQIVDASDLFGAQILPVGFEHIGAVELLGAGLAGAVFLPHQSRLSGVILDAVVACHARIALAQPADCLID